MRVPNPPIPHRNSVPERVEERLSRSPSQICDDLRSGSRSRKIPQSRVTGDSSPFGRVAPALRRAAWAGLLQPAAIFRIVAVNANASAAMYIPRGLCMASGCDLRRRADHRLAGEWADRDRHLVARDLVRGAHTRTSQGAGAGTVSDREDRIRREITGRRGAASGPARRPGCIGRRNNSRPSLPATVFALACSSGRRSPPQPREGHHPPSDECGRDLVLGACLRSHPSPLCE